MRWKSHEGVFSRCRLRLFKKLSQTRCPMGCSETSDPLWGVRPGCRRPVCKDSACPWKLRPPVTRLNTKRTNPNPPSASGEEQTAPGESSGGWTLGPSSHLHCHHSEHGCHHGRVSHPLPPWLGLHSGASGPEGQKRLFLSLWLTSKPAG